MYKMTFFLPHGTWFDRVDMSFSTPEEAFIFLGSLDNPTSIHGHIIAPWGSWFDF